MNHQMWVLAVRVGVLRTVSSTLRQETYPENYLSESFQSVRHRRRLRSGDLFEQANAVKVSIPVAQILQCNARTMVAGIAAWIDRA